MPKRLSRLYDLTTDQAHASEPIAPAWVSASAGTGKTQVLTARVLRLLLSGVDPASILCLTFTKAGAAEMADRIHSRLAYWVRLDDAKLAQDLKALGEHVTEQDRVKARRLFARVLDATGGGLRIQTIHAFCQSLLAAFPAEAGMIPGFRPLEARQERLLTRDALSDLLVEAEALDDEGLLADIQTLSIRLGEAGAESLLLRCARAREAMAALEPPELIEDRLREALGVPRGDIDAKLAEWCDEDIFDCAALRRFISANQGWGTKTGLSRVDNCRQWLAAPTTERAALLGELRRNWITLAGEFSKPGLDKLGTIEPEYMQILEALDEAVCGLLAIRAKADFIEFAAAALRAGTHYARGYAAAKRREGAVDFDDLIREARALLAQPGVGDWVRYKLDMQIDHILVDEAQDTNAGQWDIIERLAEEFFEADPEGRDTAPLRTVFAVGDFKQAIFGFQGTDPREFRAARDRFAARIGERKRELRDVSLDRSYRSSPPILEIVDKVFERLGGEAVGLDQPLRTHESAREDKPGRVSLWAPVAIDGLAVPPGGEEGWLPDTSLAFAERLAAQLGEWLSTDPEKRFWLASKGRALRPEDVLILLRSRGELASLIVARLHQEGVPVAGVDRLMLTDPLAVQDLLAALRFAAQPEDDLALANLLVSPIFGWSQDDLYGLAKGRKGSLWTALRDREERSGDVRLAIDHILNAADAITPHQLLEQILSGALQGRRKILARLGEEARDPIEELVNAALLFEVDHPPMLQNFLDWFDRGDAEIARDPSAPLDAVRVMTVHGAKGLQAPLVILADSTRDPDYARRDTISLPVGHGGLRIPLPMPRRDERHDLLATLAEDAERKDREEHWRLLYVALTRAEDHLVVSGALGPRSGDTPPDASWYAAVAAAMDGLSQVQADGRWGEVLHFDGHEPIEAKPSTARRRTPVTPIAPPPWLREPAPPESRPPRPLAPSSLGEDERADPPPGEAMRAAAARGVQLHRLFERLPELAPEGRRVAAGRWLKDSADVGDAETRTEIVEAAMRVIEDPAFAAIFSPQALAEAPIAAVVGDAVVSGAADRLLVEDERVLIVDFKSGRRVPETIADAPASHLRQMGAYAAALKVIFPGRRVEAALLYSAGPRLLALPEALLERYKPGLPDIEQSLSRAG